MRYAPVAQLDRVSGYEPEGRGFESLLAHHTAAGFPAAVFFCVVGLQGAAGGILNRRKQPMYTAALQMGKKKEPGTLVPGL